MMHKERSRTVAAVVAVCIVAISSCAFFGRGSEPLKAEAKTRKIEGLGKGNTADAPTVTPDAESSRLWTEYRGSKVGTGAAGAEIIGTVAAMGHFPSTRANVNEILFLLRSEITKEEKIKLLDLLGVVLYWNTSDSSIRIDIAREISSTALESKDKELVNAATLVYTRLEYFPDALKVLDRAYKFDAITKEDYYGEMAHMIVGSPAAEQLTLLRNIEAGRNDYSRDVLMSTLVNPQVGASLPREVQVAAASLLAKWEPDLGDPKSGFGAGEGIVWGNWLGSSVALNAHLAGEPESAAMAKFLKVDETADPRKLIVALWTEPSAEIVKSAFDRKTLASIDARLAAYAAQNPTNKDIQGDVQAARRNLASVKQK